MCMSAKYTQFLITRRSLHLNRQRPRHHPSPAFLKTPQSRAFSWHRFQQQSQLSSFSQNKKAFPKTKQVQQELRHVPLPAILCVSSSFSPQQHSLLSARSTLLAGVLVLFCCQQVMARHSSQLVAIVLQHPHLLYNLQYLHAPQCLQSRSFSAASKSWPATAASWLSSCSSTPTFCQRLLRVCFAICLLV